MLPSVMTWDATSTPWVPAYDRHLPHICICVHLSLYAVQLVLILGKIVAVRVRLSMLLTAKKIQYLLGLLCM
jgi:hypothetical protein